MRRGMMLAIIGLGLLSLGLNAANASVGRGSSDVLHSVPSPQASSGAFSPQSSSLAWTPCPPDWECATLQVPLDYSDPSGATVDLALARLPASTPSARIGSLLMNFGGPGGPTISSARGWVKRLAPEIRQRFDIVAMDPRGVGQSSPIDCVQNLQQFYGADGTPDSEEEWQTLVALAKEFAANCAKNGEILNHIGTRDVVRDVDQVRIALAEDQITYLGYSYGTTIGQLYADTYPSHLRAGVLDGAYRFWDTDTLFEQTLAFEKALDTFLLNCTADPSCPLALRGDPPSLLKRLLSDIEAKPIPAPGSDRPLRPGEAITGISEALYSAGRWPALAKALAQAVDGDGTALNKLADSYLSRAANGTYGDLLAVYAAVTCVDGAPVTEAGLRAEAARHNAAAPRIGSDNLLKSALPCAFWPAPAQPLIGPVHAAGAPPILVIATTGDPATPYDQGVEVAHSLSSGVLLTHVGEGHTIYTGGNECIDGATNDYLLRLVVPESGSSCDLGATQPVPPSATETPTVAAEDQSVRAADSSNPLYPLVAGLIATAVLAPATMLTITIRHPKR